MHLPKSIISSFILLFAFTACDPGSRFNYTIENKSGKKLVCYNIFASNIFLGFKLDTFSLEPGESTTLRGDKMGSYHYLKNDYLKDKDYCACGGKIETADTNYKINREPNHGENWEHSDKQISRFNGGGEFNCRLVITDEDIQHK
jgi:hypothetical protein